MPDPMPSAAAQVIADALYADHIDCDPDSCCQRNSGPDLVEATKVLNALWGAGYQITERGHEF
jgi:hypothetical protein